MRIQLSDQQRQLLMGFPEEGMGYHLVHVRLHNGITKQNVKVFNGTVMEWPADAQVQADDIADMTLGGGA